MEDYEGGITMMIVTTMMMMTMMRRVFAKIKLAAVHTWSDRRRQAVATVLTRRSFSPFWPRTGREIFESTSLIIISKV